MKKVLLSVAALLLVLIVAAGAWFYSSLDSLVLAAIEKLGPEMTQATVKVRVVKLSPTDGVGVIGGLSIGNPRGFKTGHALKAETTELAVDLASVARDVIVIRRIAVHAPDINYETSDAGSNFDVIQNNVQGYVKRLRGTPDAAARDRAPAKKLIVDALSIRDARVSYTPALLKGKSVTLTLPNIELRNIGRAKGGVTPGELVSEIVAALKGQLVHAVAQSVKDAAGAAVDATKNVGSKLKALFK